MQVAFAICIRVRKATIPRVIMASTAAAPRPLPPPEQIQLALQEAIQDLTTMNRPLRWQLANGAEGPVLKTDMPSLNARRLLEIQSKPGFT